MICLPTSPSLYCVSLPPLPQPLQFSTAVTPPTITVQPTDQFMVIPGSSSTFNVSVRAVPGHDHTYQWQKNETNISEATSGTLTISDVTKADDEALYNCIVSNAAGAVTSDSAKLTVCKSNVIVFYQLSHSFLLTSPFSSTTIHFFPPQ